MATNSPPKMGHTWIPPLMAGVVLALPAAAQSFQVHKECGSCDKTSKGMLSTGIVATVVLVACLAAAGVAGHQKWKGTLAGSPAVTASRWSSVALAMLAVMVALSTAMQSKVVADDKACSCKAASDANSNTAMNVFGIVVVAALIGAASIWTSGAGVGSVTRGNASAWGTAMLATMALALPSAAAAAMTSQEASCDTTAKKALPAMAVVGALLAVVGLIATYCFGKQFTEGKGVPEKTGIMALVFAIVCAAFTVGTGQAMKEVDDEAACHSSYAKNGGSLRGWGIFALVVTVVLAVVHGFFFHTVKGKATRMGDFLAQQSGRSLAGN